MSCINHVKSEAEAGKWLPALMPGVCNLAMPGEFALIYSNRLVLRVGEA